MEDVPLLPLPPPEERYKLRKQLMGLTLAQAAAEIGDGVAPNSLRRWEKGFPMTADNHRKYQAVIARWRDTVENYPLS